MKELKGSKTEECLKTAFAGESQAAVKYSFYAKQAQKDGYQQIGAIFSETAHNEHTHAKIWFKLLHDGGVPPTPTNLLDAAAGEEYEYKDMYKEFAAVAREEGFNAIAVLFEKVGEIERTHMERYRTLLKNIEDGLVFTRDGDRMWMCRECGNIHIGKKAPEICPVCKHPQAFFELRPENY
ncbi:MAG: rubrerythrin family protein [Bacteroides sp.]|nr:rubrerythrin family protein [Bacteroides sp.]MBD5306529.1 rubrerythrin family protein [Bacteroides sp.]